MDHQSHQTWEVSEVATIRRWMPDQRLERLTTINPGCESLDCVNIVSAEHILRPLPKRSPTYRSTTERSTMGRYTIQRSTKELSATRASAIEHMIQEVNYINIRYATFDLPGPDRHIHKFRIGLLILKRIKFATKATRRLLPGRIFGFPLNRE